jgi:serine phosphatase RsbU (regulator of sigma subunit)
LYSILLDENVFIFLKTGVLCELLVFTFGLSYRYTLIEADKQKFQNQLIFQLRENADLHEKVNRELADKVKERTLEIEAQRDILITQKNQIEQINTEIKDSINYARYIQSSILPKPEQLESYLGEHFVLCKPKDIVSGDFYWISNIKNKTIIAAADCTGHGVPGAFMSMLGTAFLNEIVNKEYITHPGVILRRLREEVINSLQQKGERGEQKDGMDIALCTIDMENMKLQFAGAISPLYLVRASGTENFGLIHNVPDEDKKLYEIKGDFMPIGIHEQMKNFTFHEIDLYKADIFYLFTDGFPDQFGGPICKKFGYKKFRELLLKNNYKTMPEQKIILEKELVEWMGNNSQIDDILVIGFRIN